MHTFEIGNNGDEGLFLQLFCKIRVESVFDRVVSPSRDFPGYAAPLVAIDAVQSDYFHIFFYRPFVLANIWIQVDMPTFPTLLSNAAW